MMVDQIAPGHDWAVEFEVLLLPGASNVLYERLAWQVQLYLRDRMIEYHQDKIRVVPTFACNTRSDVVLMTCTTTDRREFLAYSYMLQLCGFNFNCWDVERYAGSWNPEMTWVGFCHMLLICDARKSVDMLRMCDVRGHLGDPSHTIVALGTQNSKFDHVLYDLNNPILERLAGVKSADGKTFGSYLSCCWFDDVDHVQSQANKARRSQESTDPQSTYLAQYRVAPEEATSTTCFYYTLGDLRLFRAGATKSTRIVTQPSPLVGSGYVPYIYDGTFFKAKIEAFPVDSPFTQALLSLISVLPLKRRLHLYATLLVCLVSFKKKICKYLCNLFFK
jgi:hypothetical protein